LGKDPQAVVATANGDDVRNEYRTTTEAAHAMGIFGSPTFVCGKEIFWGDDRLEDAIDWCIKH
jgi:2-hydroxychromene-2-carboxylate isomerase